MFTIHSLDTISLQIEEATKKNDIDGLVNRLILEKFGEEMESKDGIYKLISKFSE